MYAEIQELVKYEQMCNGSDLSRADVIIETMISYAPSCDKISFYGVFKLIHPRMYRMVFFRTF